MSSPGIKIKSRGRLSLEEATERFGDPSLNVHPEENTGIDLSLVSMTGNPYSVHLGLPTEPITGAYGAVKQFDPSYQPHVFTTNRFVLRSRGNPNQLLVDEADLRVLHMHARRNKYAWVPSDPALESKGVTIPDIVASFENATDWPIDVIWACQMSTDKTANVFNPGTDHKYIYPVSGYAQGSVRLERGEITVSMEEAPDEHSLVVYHGWVNSRIGSIALK